jgi:predicted enzyme related to lactoylglutathione lyase
MMGPLYLVELSVSDWPAAVAWYTGVLGLQLIHTDETNRFALLLAGPVRLALKAGTPAGGCVLLAFEVPDIERAVQILAERGAQPEGPIKDSPEGYRRAIFRDPDGYRVSLFDWRKPE